MDWMTGTAEIGDARVVAGHLAGSRYHAGPLADGALNAGLLTASAERNPTSRCWGKQPVVM